MAANPEPSHLRAVEVREGEPLDAEGFALAYAALERVRGEHDLRRLTIVVDDVDLGRQLLVVPRGELPVGVGTGRAWFAEPPRTEPSTAIELVVAVGRSAVRVAVLDDRGGAAIDTVELALRRLPGVEAVAISAGADVLRVQLAATAEEDVVPRALEVVRAHLDRTVVIEVVRAGRGTSDPSDVPALPPGTAAMLEIVAVRSEPDRGELEVHLRAGDVRTVGRAPRNRGLVGAAEATLEAWHARPGAPRHRVAWARTVETSTDARFVVAVALDPVDRALATHGIGTGPNPIEAAVHATADALSR